MSSDSDSVNNRIPWLVITSVSAPNTALRMFASGCCEYGYHFVVIGDSKSPGSFELEGCDFWSLQRQQECGFSYERLCPTKHYARKNIGYLLAIREHAAFIRDTDDDNLPRAAFWGNPARSEVLPSLEDTGWINVYRYFSEASIWPRGLPLDKIHEAVPDWDTIVARHRSCPIQQGLADANPDVDAIYRLLLPLPQNFRTDRRLALGAGAWCPFNSQNTTWFPEAFPLLYLPAYCSFRMTDIWRSFVAQRIAWANDWAVLFHEPTVWQERNEHDLMRDFSEEVPGYLENSRIAAELAALPIESGLAQIPSNLRMCYKRLVQLQLVGEKEIELLDAWLHDLTVSQT